MCDSIRFGKSIHRSRNTALSDIRLVIYFTMGNNDVL